MIDDRLLELEGRVQATRQALETLAERAASLRTRLASARREEAASTRGAADATPAAPAQTVPGIAPPNTVPPAVEAPPEAAALASSLDRLTHTPWVPVVTSGHGEGDDGRLVSDAWEIALISEEGK